MMDNKPTELIATHSTDNSYVDLSAPARSMGSISTQTYSVRFREKENELLNANRA